MAQHDMVIDNGPGLAVRTDINAALAALASSSSGTVEPLTRVPGQLWFNSTSGILQIRNPGNTAWTPIMTNVMDGNITVGTTNNWVQWTGTSSAVGNSLLAVRDNRATTGAAGNAVFGIKRQNSATDALLLGNDGNSAALIGGNNVPLRFGNWINGVFTERMNMTGAGVFTFGGSQQVIIGGAVGIEITGSQPNIKLSDTDANAYDFWMHGNSNIFYILCDRTATGTWDTPHPLELRAATNQGYLFGSEILTAANAPFVPNTRTVTAGNGLTGGGALSANITLTLGTPLTITGSSTNSVTATQHSHALTLPATVMQPFTGTSSTETINFPVGHTLLASGFAASILNNAAVSIRLHSGERTNAYEVGTGADLLAGQWRARGRVGSTGMAQRIS